MASTRVFIVDHTNQGPRPMSEEYEEDNQWLVEALLGKRVLRGKTQYLVSWKGDWPPAEKTTWEFAINVGKDILQDLKRSGVILPSHHGNDGYRSDSEDDDKMDLDGSDDSGSEYDPDDDDDYRSHRSKKAKARLPRKSDTASDGVQQVDDFGSPAIAAKTKQLDEEQMDNELIGEEQMDEEQIDQDQIDQDQIVEEQTDEEHARARKSAALLAQAKANADLDAMNALWEFHGTTIKLPVPASLRQGPAMMQPAAHQPIQAPTVNQNGFANSIYNPMLQQAAQQPIQAPTVTQTGFVDFVQQPYQAPSTVRQNGSLTLFQQPIQAPMASQNVFLNLIPQPNQAHTVRQTSFINFGQQPIQAPIAK
jgi:hypothetical protein